MQETRQETRPEPRQDTTYTYAGVAKILDVSESKLRNWAQVGYVGPSVRATGKMLFSFQDLISVKAPTMDAGLAAAHSNLGHLAYGRGDVAGARTEFEAALALDPEQPEARFNLANMILEAGDLELAVAELRRVLQAEPDFADAHYNLAVALGRLGGRAQARAHLERYIGLESNPTPWAAEARALIERLAD